MLLLPFLIQFDHCLQLYWDANCKAITDFGERDLCKVRTMNMDQHHWWGWLGVKVISLSGCWLHKCLHVSYMSELSSNFFCYIVTTSFTSLQATWCRFSVKPCMCQDLTCQMIALQVQKLQSYWLCSSEWNSFQCLARQVYDSVFLQSVSLNSFCFLMHIFNKFDVSSCCVFIWWARQLWWVNTWPQIPYLDEQISHVL